MTFSKKLIEVALPLQAINNACKSDKDRKTGHIRNIHKWFAPMPLPALRAIIFSSIIDDPGEDSSREHLLKVISDLVSSGPEHPADRVLAEARDLIKKQLDGQPLWVLDPFCGGGSTLVEAQRLGLRSEGSDLNPIPLMISKALTVLPARNRSRAAGSMQLATFESDIRKYAEKVREVVKGSIAHMFPVAPNGDPIIYWWWAHTVRSPNPAFGRFRTPLVTSWWLSRRSGEVQYLQPSPNKETGRIDFEVVKGRTPPSPNKDRCIFSNDPITYEYVREQARQGHLGRMLLAYASDGKHGRKQWPADTKNEVSANVRSPSNLPDLEIPSDGLGISVQNYGFHKWKDLFTPRQQQTLLAFAQAIQRVPEWVESDGESLQYGCDIASFLGLCLGKLAQASSEVVRLNVRNGPNAKAEPAFARGDLQLNWDFAETNPFAKSVGDWNQIVTTALRAYKLIDPSGPAAEVHQSDARVAGKAHKGEYLIITDPPYFAAIGYADLSEYFYYWIRIALKDIQPAFFSTIAVPKLNELIASPKRHGSRANAAAYFVEGFTETFKNLAGINRSGLPLVVVYAQRQEEQSSGSTVSTGWEAMLEAIIRANLAITGTWPISGTGEARMRAHRANALGSYIVIVCRPRDKASQRVTRREFVDALKSELPESLRLLQRGNIAPVDLAQAAIGPGMAVYTRYEKVLDAGGKPLTVREALALINQTLDEVLAEQEGDFDGDTRWALAWFEEFGFEAGEYGRAETLSKAKNTSVNEMADPRTSPILEARAGKVRLFRPDELEADWTPESDGRLTVWDMVHQLVRVLENDGETAAAAIVAKLGAKAETARELCYLLYTMCERKKRAAEALSYNGLVQSWPEIMRLAQQQTSSTGGTVQTFEFTEQE
ncbi:MAG: DUF1156 domain-containing protein [Chloracidobacterium sp.]|nr:DUF1156 domain-containing protein [Chloracidobacterium sp.]